jgi:hypothetical protein
MPWLPVGLSGEYETFVDDQDVPLYLSRPWHFDGRYVKHRKAGKRNGPDKPRDPATFTYLHRAIMQPPTGFVVDHIDGNGLYNARNNLRICTQMENSQNRAFVGVTYDAKYGVWQASFMHDVRYAYDD